MDELTFKLLADLKKSSIPVEAKIASFNSLKSSIKHQRIPESAQPATLECIRQAIVAQTSPSLVTTGFSCLGHLIKRLTLQDQIASVFSHRANILPALLERLGDVKETYRDAAFQALTDLWPAKSADVEAAVRDGAIKSSNVRAKEAGIQWVAKMHDEHGLQFKTFVTPILECLDNADGTVRECAKTNIVELFRGAPDRAKNDLKKQLVALEVRKSIATYILTQLRLQLPLELEDAATVQAHAPPQLRSKQSHADIGSADAHTPDILPPPSAEAAHIDPLFVDDQRELEDMFRDMYPPFEGKEHEGNWLARDKNALKLRRLLKGNAPSEFPVAFIMGIKGLLEGILKVVNTLRTTMSTNGCVLVQELATTLGPALDPLVEILMQSLIKMCAATKHISAQNGNVTVGTIIAHVSYNNRLMQHIWSACQDKNVQPRIFASAWLMTVINRQLHNKGHFEHSGGVETADKCIRKGLLDPNPKVREGMRAAYWLFAQTWPMKADAIMETLDAKSKQLLEKDASNPNAMKSSAFTASVGVGAVNPRAAASAIRSTLKEQIAAQKKALLTAKRLPDRPGSAMAALSPVKQAVVSSNRIVSNTSSTSKAPPPSKSTTSSRPPNTSTTSKTGPGGLMSAPVRRPRKADIPRPATADPYASRRLHRAETPEITTPNRPTSKSSASSVTSGNARGAFGVSTSRPGTSDSGHSSLAVSPHISPPKNRPLTMHGPGTGASQARFEHVASSPGSKLAKPAPDSPGSRIAKMASESRTPRRSPVPLSKQTIETGRPGSEHSALPQAVEESDDVATPLSFKPHASPSIKEERSMNEAEVDQVAVFEDPETKSATPTARHPETSVLEELPPNERQNPKWSGDENEQMGSNAANRSMSPTKKGDPDALKNRRLLLSGIERIHARTLDPHGFRRLQELVRTGSPEYVTHMGTLLRALLEYIEQPNESLKVSTSKAHGLKSQALSIMRAIITLHRRDEHIRQDLARALLALIRAKETIESTSHVGADLDKTADEIIKNAGDQIESYIESVSTLIEQYESSSECYKRTTTMALGSLARLLVQAQVDGVQAIPGKQRQRLCRLAVHFLDDADPDVRRADTEFCLELRGLFAPEANEEFWTALKGAREAQLNLVAYYLARRRRAGT